MVIFALIRVKAFHLHNTFLLVEPLSQVLVNNLDYNALINYLHIHFVSMERSFIFTYVRTRDVQTLYGEI